MDLTLKLSRSNLRLTPVVSKPLVCEGHYNGYEMESVKDILLLKKKNNLPSGGSGFLISLRGG